MTLIEALKALDTTNDTHWTKDGLPLLAVLSEMTGKEVSRADITTVAPNFNRYNTNLTSVETSSPWNAAAPVITEGGERTIGDGGSIPEGETLPRNPNNDVVLEEPVSALKGAELVLEAAKYNLEAAQAAFNEAQSNYNAELEKHEKASQMDHADIMRHYLASNRMEAQSTQERLQKLAETAKSLNI